MWHGCLMYFLYLFVISGHDGFRHLLLCYLLKTPVLHSRGSLSCPGNRSCWICGRFPNEPIPKRTQSARISDMDGYFLDVTTRRLVVYGGKEGVLVSPHLLDHLACFAQVNVRDIPQWRVLREHIIRELSLQYAVALSSFHGFPAFRQMGCIFMWMAMQMTEVANSKKEIDEYNQEPADSILESI